ncbi:MAG: DUF4339 domain-containing protein [Bacteroidales bacterium]|nr:DUF4339 domain-containing protein [Bacteroidales bacterium]
MDAMDFDALILNNQGFNTLDNLAQSNVVQDMAKQTLQNIQTMQTPMPAGHVPQHVVLPVFQKQQLNNGEKQTEKQFFVIINGVQKGPFTLEQVKGLAIADVIDTDTQVWMPGMPNWTDLKTCLSQLNQ